ncbi:hypothetical protein TNCV_4568081 [Trichonephila clavipes]|nr:hypothetical protein TNCV_4568081 [Trichonephila clavipes]
MNVTHGNVTLIRLFRLQSGIPLKRKGGMFSPATLKPVVCNPTNKRKSKVPSFDLSGAPPSPLSRAGVANPMTSRATSEKLYNPTGRL